MGHSHMPESKLAQNSLNLIQMFKELYVLIVDEPAEADLALLMRSSYI